MVFLALADNNNHYQYSPPSPPRYPGGCWPGGMGPHPGRAGTPVTYSSPESAGSIAIAAGTSISLLRNQTPTGGSAGR